MSETAPLAGLFESPEKIEMVAYSTGWRETESINFPLILKRVLADCWAKTDKLKIQKTAGKNIFFNIQDLKRAQRYIEIL